MAALLLIENYEKMRIELTLNGNPYAIDVDEKVFTPTKLGLTKEGKPKEEQLGFYTNLSNAAKRLCREEIASSTDTVSLNEFASRVATINKQLLDQLELIQV